MLTATAFDNRNGNLKAIKVTFQRPYGADAATVRKIALKELYRHMDAGRSPVNLVGFQLWSQGGITWYPIRDEPLFSGDLTLQEQLMLDS